MEQFLKKLRCFEQLFFLRCSWCIQTPGAQSSESFANRFRPKRLFCAASRSSKIRRKIGGLSKLVTPVLQDVKGITQGMGGLAEGASWLLILDELGRSVMQLLGHRFNSGWRGPVPVPGSRACHAAFCARCRWADPLLAGRWTGAFGAKQKHICGHVNQPDSWRLESYAG